MNRETKRSFVSGSQMGPWKSINAHSTGEKQQFTCPPITLNASKTYKNENVICYFSSVKEAMRFLWFAPVKLFITLSSANYICFAFNQLSYKTILQYLTQRYLISLKYLTVQYCVHSLHFLLQCTRSYGLQNIYSIQVPSSR